MKFKHGTRRRALEYEKDIAQTWKKNKTFEKSVENRSADNAYVFYDGPPFITGVPHHGTLLSSIVKDAVPRYWTMKGKRVERVWGWDCHGLPAENFVEKQLNITDRRQIMTVDKKNAKPNFVILHGFTGKASKNFLPWLKTELKKQGYKVETPELPNTDNPSESEQVDFAMKNCDINENTILIGHSLGGAVAIKILEKISHKIYGLVLVAPVMEKDFYHGERISQGGKERKFLDTFSLTVDHEKIKEKASHRLILQAHNDDPARAEYMEYLAPKISAKLYAAEAEKSHFCGEKETFILDNIKTLLAEGETLRDKDGNELSTISLEAYITKARESMVANSETWEDVIDRIGRWVDFKGAYRTMDKDFMESVWWAFKELYEAGKIYEGEKVLMYDTRFATPVSKNEVTMDNDAYQTVTDPSLYAKFKLVDSDAHVLAWTTTPWTLPANLMLAVSPELTYCEVLASGERLIIAEEALERVMKDEKHKPLEYEVVRKFPGSELVGKPYEPLDTGSSWPENDAVHKIYAADFVSHESGTGIVHCAPAYGEDDFELAKANGIEAFHVIDDNGYYFDTNYNGLEVWENNKRIAKDLMGRGVAWKIEYIRHEYPFNPRSKQRIMYRAIPSWFFDVQGQKPLMLEQNENVNWFPEHLKHGRFAKNIEQAPDWNLSRDRFWATAMPVWKGDNGTVKVVGSYAELKELSGVELEDYHRPWVDDITFEIDGETFTRIDKVLDCWFESGSMPFAQLHYPFENQEKFEKNYPADFIVEYVGQVRAWFYYVHAVNTTLADIGAFGKDSQKPEKNAFKNVITTGVVAGNDGRKMSKSLGNFTDPTELMDKFSADSLRFLLLSSPLLKGEDFSLLDKDVGDVARKLSMVWNMYDFFTMYAEVDGWEFDATKPFTLNPDDLTNPLDKWIVSRVHQLNEEITEHMDAYDIPSAMEPILPFLDDASNWYVRRSRRRFWKSEDDGDKNDAYRTLHYVLLKLSVILAPFTPFLAEELYQKLGGGEESVHLLNWPANYTVDQQIVDEMAEVREYINEGLSLRAKASLKVRQPLASVTVPSLGEAVDCTAILLDELNVKEVKIGKEVAIDETITPELKREGLMREVIRHIQSARKQAGLQVDDRILFSLRTEDGELSEAIKEHLEAIATEVLGEWYTEDDLSYTTEVKVESKELTVGLEKK